jgi:hypothetical protein
MVRSRDGLAGWLLAAVSSEDEGEERNENSWQLQFPLSCVRIESLCDSVGCRRKVTQSERKKAAAQHTHNSGRQAGRDREEEEDGGSSEKFRMFWQRRKRFFPQQQSFGCCVAAAAPVTIEYIDGRLVFYLISLLFSHRSIKTHQR